MPPLFLFDTNTVSCVMADHPKVKARLSLQPGQVITCAIVRGEIRYGLERLPIGKRRTNLEAKASAVLATLPIEPITSSVGDIYGRSRHSLEMQGFNLSDNDLWIAATALSLGAVLVSNDQAFSRVPGLTVEDWTV
jgi:tRNA(fMet)-specific endonuclease VapC